MALLACSRIGAPHSVVFGGFSADSLRDRIQDAEAKVLITGDGAWRRGEHRAAEGDGRRRGRRVPVDREGAGAAAHRTRRPDDRGTRRVVARPRAAAVEPTASPSTWTPRTCSISSTRAAPPRSPRASCTPPAATSRRSRGRTSTSSTCSPDTDVYWCSADVGWVTGHSYIVYGPLANRATSVLYEGTPDFPEKDRLWQIIEQYKVTILYTAPTAIRTFMKWGSEYPESRDLSSLRLLGTVGEPINPEAWVWYWQHIGGERCPVVDTWWQTETGAIMISPLPGATTLKPGSATFPLPGVGADIVSNAGESVGIPGGGYLGAHATVAGDAARHLGRPGALPRHVLGSLRGPVLRGRRREARRRRLLLAARPGRRRDARVGAQHLDRRGRARARRASRGRRGRGRRHEGRHHRSGDQRVRDPPRRHRAERRARRRAARPRRPHHRPDRQAEEDPLHRRSPEDQVGQDHASPAARRGRGPGARRHHHARRPVRRRRHQVALPRDGTADED